MSIESGVVGSVPAGAAARVGNFREWLGPFCATKDRHRLAVLAIGGEGNLRIDYCESCRAFLKTYIGEGRESFFLADWMSLYLDLMALDRGLQRCAASLYEL